MAGTTASQTHGLRDACKSCSAALRSNRLLCTPLHERLCMLPLSAARTTVCYAHVAALNIIYSTSNDTQEYPSHFCLPMLSASIQQCSTELSDVNSI